MRPVLIGQAPGPNTDPERPLWPEPRTSSGGRLAEAMSLSITQYLLLFERANLVNRFPGKYKRDDKFPLYEAQIAAAALRPLMRGRDVILLGRKVASAWGEGVDLPFFEWSQCRTFGTRLAVVPHPSGRNHWYNHETNRELATSFWRTLVASLNGQAEPLQLGQEIFA